jgi:hypothetical protein
VGVGIDIRNLTLTPIEYRRSNSLRPYIPNISNTPSPLAWRLALLHNTSLLRHGSLLCMALSRALRRLLSRRSLFGWRAGFGGRTCRALRCSFARGSLLCRSFGLLDAGASVGSLFRRRFLCGCFLQLANHRSSRGESFGSARQCPVTLASDSA